MDTDDDEQDDWNPTCALCGFDSNCRECWERDGSLWCHSCAVEGRYDT